MPEPRPDEEQPRGGVHGPAAGEPAQDGPGPAADCTGGPGRSWLPGGAETGPAPGGAETGPVPGGERPGPQPGRLAAGLDYGALVEALAASGALDTDPEDQDAELAERVAAEEEGRLGSCDPAVVAALAVEYMDPGAAQAGWLEVAAAAVGRLDENGLAGVAIAGRRAASRAQAAELAAVAQVTARAAAADPKIGLEADGRPARVCRDALGQIALALGLTHYGAEAWADLAVTLTWRLRATGQALAAGRVDLARARAIAEATSVLGEQAARAVEEQVLPGAGSRTAAELRVRLRRAVIAADPEGAEQRRRDAERLARVSLYGDEDGTATLAGSKLPAVQAAAAMARITAIARAMKAAGQAGGLDLHRARVLIGLLLGTLPPIPPADGAPPDQSPPGDPDPDSDSGPAGRGPHHGGPGGNNAGGPGGGGPRDDLPAPRDEDAPPDDGLDGTGPEDQAGDPAEEDDDRGGTGPVPAWPALGVIPPALARRPAQPDGRPAAGLLDAVLPWTTLAGLSQAPGSLGRIGPVCAAQARQLAQAAAADPGAQWRVIVTNGAGQAIAVARIRRRRGRDRDGPGTARAGSAPARAGPPGAGLVGRMTVTVSQDTIIAAQHPGRPGRPGPPGGIAAAALRTASRALELALDRAGADTAAGGCAHHAQSPGYRPPPRLREYVIARDLTCRSPVCRQPAWRGDLDHTRPWDDGGRTCSCNLGGGCRRDHQLKQHPRWKLDQIRPGVFRWITPAGRAYVVGPDIHPV